jgi:cell division protein FtsA
VGAGVVISGGATLIPGVDEVAAEILGMPVKIGYPSGISYQGLAPEVESPMYSTCVGLALYGVKKAKEAGIEVEYQSDESTISK